MLNGYETIPLSNGWDNHGKYIAHINRNDDISVVIGYIHKFIPLKKEFGIGDMLSSLKIYKVPVIFVVPEKNQAKAKKLLANKGVKYFFADPSEITEVALSVLKGKPARKKKTK